MTELEVPISTRDDKALFAPDYVGEPNYPAPWTTHQPKEGLRDFDAARIVCLAPDVCLTPIGDTAVPIPYQIVDYAGHDAGYAESVRFTGKKAMTLASRTTHVHGDAPGTKKGVKSGTVEDVTEPIGHAPEVRAEGHPVIRHLDRFHMNSRNTVGEAIYVKDTAGYEPPVDDDPVPGSLFMVTVTPAQMEQPAQQQQNAGSTGMGGGNTGSITIRPPRSSSLGGRGSFGQPVPLDPRMLRALRFWSGANAAANVADMLHAIAEDSAVQRSASDLGLDLNTPRGTLIARANAWSRHHLDFSPFYWDFPNSDLGRRAATRAITSMEAASPGTLGEALNGNKERLTKLRNAIRNAVAAATAVQSVRVSGEPCAALAQGIPGSKYRGGAHYAMSLPPGDGLDSHHTPAASISYLPRWAGPSVQMTPEDHRLTLSYGRSAASAYPAGQARLVNSGRFMAAIMLDVADIKRIASLRRDPSRYDSAIAQMLAYANCLKEEGIIK